MSARPSYDARALNRARRFIRGDFNSPSGITRATASKVIPKKSIDGTGSRR